MEDRRLSWFRHRSKGAQPMYIANLVYDGRQSVEQWHRVRTEVAHDRRVAAERGIVVAARVVDGGVQRRQVELFRADHHAEARSWTHAQTGQAVHMPLISRRQAIINWRIVESCSLLVQHRISSCVSRLGFQQRNTKVRCWFFCLLHSSKFCASSGVASYGTLGHVPPRLPTISF